MRSGPERMEKTERRCCGEDRGNAQILTYYPDSSGALAMVTTDQSVPVVLYQLLPMPSDSEDIRQNVHHFWNNTENCIFTEESGRSSNRAAE